MAPWQGIGCTAVGFFETHRATTKPEGEKMQGREIRVAILLVRCLRSLFLLSFRSRFSIMARIVCDFEVLASAMPDYRWALDNALPGKTPEEKKAAWEQVQTCLAYALKREGMKGQKGIENQLLLKRFSAWLQGMQPESHGFALSSTEDYFLVEVCMTAEDLQGWVQVCQNAVDISEMLAGSAKHLAELCELLRAMHRDRETYWCAEAY